MEPFTLYCYNLSAPVVSHLVTLGTFVKTWVEFYIINKCAIATVVSVHAMILCYAQNEDRSRMICAAVASAYGVKEATVATNFQLNHSLVYHLEIVNVEASSTRSIYRFRDRPGDIVHAVCLSIGTC